MATINEYERSLTIHLPTRVLALLKEIDVHESEVENFILSTIERVVNEQRGRDNKVFSEEEIKELEDNLKGLGYI